MADASDQGEDLGLVKTAQAKVRRIMSDNAGSSQLSPDAVLAMSRAAELFVLELAGKCVGIACSEAAAAAAAGTSGASSKKAPAPALNYKDVAAGVRAWDAADFLRDTVPFTVSGAEYKASREAAAAAAAAAPAAAHQSVLAPS